ncbi:MAG: ATP-binding protein [Rhodospirillaceae bacterium]
MNDTPTDSPYSWTVGLDLTRQHRRFGILAKVLGAFSVVAAMAVLSGMVAWLSFRSVENELEVVVGRAVPAMSTAEALAVEATGIASATATLAATLSEGQRDELMTALAGRVVRLNGRLDELMRLRVGSEVVNPLRDRIATLATNLKLQSDLVAERIVLRSQLHSDATSLASGHKRFLNAVTPRVDNTYRSLFAGIKTLVDDLGSSRPADGKATAAAPASYQDMVVLQRRIGILFNRNVGEMLALLQLAAGGNLAAGLLNEAILITDPPEVHQLRSRFNEVTISMGAIRLNLATTSENQLLLGLVMPMLQFGLGSDNLFDRRLHELRLISASEAVVAENRTLSEALTEAVNLLLISSRDEAERHAREVLADVAYARTLQTLAAGLAVLMALIIGWRYVGRTVIGRILALQRAMEAEAAGREMVIPADGDDEIADMAGALAHFVTRRKLAETELRAAKERAEGALTELKALQETLVQAEKMASLGGLVAGVAHELNTPVGVCLTAASLLGEKTATLAQDFEAGQLRKSMIINYLTVASEVYALLRTNLERAGDLIRVFKQVAIAPGEGERHIFRLYEHIDIVAGLAAESIRGGGHHLSIECPAELILNGFPEALRHVLTALLDNALFHGVADDGTGTVAVTISAQSAEAGTITLKVTDNGVGIRPEHLAHLFEPFFTTRRHRGGIGLGLHMAFNIVSSVLGGRITAESLPGRGSCFQVTIPATSPATAQRRHS